MPSRLSFLRCLALLVLPAVALLVAGEGEVARADLLEYVKKADATTSWKLKKKVELDEGTVYDLRLVSQKWQGITWEHALQVYLPKGVKPGATMFLWNTGGNPSPRSMLQGLTMAQKMQAPVAFLYNVPNQPLLGGKREDALIAETFVRYLKTGDNDWPLLFPMVKSVVKAMDALQELARMEWGAEVTHFVVSGASKRGWTAWLTGAADGRVKAIAPLVFDMLDMPKQLDNQLRSFGAYSEMIRDYTRAGLVPLPDTPRAKQLWGMVDPWAYRSRLKMPKLIVVGTNDPYWALDATNLHWDSLQGDRWLLYVPNAGHNLQQKEGKSTSSARVGDTLAAFARAQIHGRALPKLEWRHEEAGGKFRLTVRAAPAPKAARLWLADAPTRDFRKASWSSRPAALADGSASATVEAPAGGCRAFFGELEYEEGGLRYYLSTQLRIVGAPVPRPAERR